MKKAAFTICAKNYIGLALVLEKSIKKQNPDIEFFIFVADEFDGSENVGELPANVLIARNHIDIESKTWTQMAFKYDLTEFCTSIKPSCFKYLFKNHELDACIYFDPDILVFNSLDIIYNGFKEKSIIVTPHTTTIETRYTGKLSERNLFYSGMFNLGFIGLRGDEVTNKMLNWWENRLRDKCFQNMAENYFTDQKWMDFLPSFFPNDLLVSSNLGLNVAPWNFYEREVLEVGSSYVIKNRILKSIDKQDQLIFIHFSGFNYRSLVDDKVSQGNIQDLEIYYDFNKPIADYIKALKQSNILKYINLTYSYGTFSDGVQITSIYRKLFRRLFEDEKIHSNPFDSKNDFYKSLKKSKILDTSSKPSSKVSIHNFEGIERKSIKINKFLHFIFKIMGARRFFLMTRVMRLYSIPENHVYLINSDYYKNYKIRN